MSVEVIHYKNNLLGHRILLGQQPLYFLCLILSSPSLLGIGISPSGQRLCKKENACCAVAYILVVLILNAVLFGAESFAEVGKKLNRLFIHANNGIVFVIWATVYLKHILHRGHKSGTVFRGIHQHFFRLGLNSSLLRNHQNIRKPTFERPVWYHTSARKSVKNPQKACTGVRADVQEGDSAGI